MEKYKQITLGWVFEKTNSDKVFDLAGLKLTAEYTLRVLSNMTIGESVIMTGYAIKRIK